MSLTKLFIRIVAMVFPLSLFSQTRCDYFDLNKLEKESLYLLFIKTNDCNFEFKINKKCTSYFYFSKEGVTICNSLQQGLFLTIEKHKIIIDQILVFTLVSLEKESLDFYLEEDLSFMDELSSLSPFLNPKNIIYDETPTNNN